MSDYNIEYLTNLIENKVEESLHLDYKASAALGKQNDKTGEISKDVSAMANSDGGILIYGIAEDEKERHLPKEIQPIKRKEFSKEWLEQTIQDKIQPRINGIKIHSVSIGTDEVVYVLEIPKSNTAHQANDKKYYKRFNFLSTAMYDYEIRDILNRTKSPQIELRFKYSNKGEVLYIIAHNIGSVYAQYVNVKIRLPKNIVVSQADFKLIGNETIEISAKNSVRDMVDPFATVARFYPPRYEPILPQSEFELKKLTLRNHPFDYENILEWEIFCDNSNPTHGAIRLCDILKS